MIGKIKTMAIITFYIAVLLVIAVYLQDGSGTFSHFFEMQIYTYVICVMYMLRLSIKLMTIICNFFHSYFYSD